MRKPVNE